MRPTVALWCAAMVLFHCARGLSQGAVRQTDPRRPAALVETAGCDLWEGDISGNDPTAEATMQLCTEGERVTGVFLWSSLVSGWDRRAFDGQWSDANRRLTLRDTQMLDLHPTHGWSLCMADRYDLRLTAPGRLEGTFTSAACHDRGVLRLSLRGRTNTAPMPRPPANTALRIHAQPDERTTERTRDQRWRCNASPGWARHGASGSVALILQCFMAFRSATRGRRSPSDRRRA